MTCDAPRRVPQDQTLEKFMRIAVLNSWPNLEFSAERELIARLRRACSKMDWACIEVVTSEDILQANADCVLVTHEYSPKLTGVPTIGLLWSPPVFFQDDSIRVRSILSYDGYLAGSGCVRQYLEDMLFSTGKDTPISEWDVLPTAPQTVFNPPDLASPSLFYTGVHWDGRRHNKLIRRLCSSLPMALYGDPAKWKRYGSSYHGTIPFDGFSIFEKINSAGVALCLHRQEHLESETPSMRIFEAAAAGSVIITEDTAFARRHFNDAVLYIDPSADKADQVEQIRVHFDWIRAHQNDALEMARESHAIFNEYFAIERWLARLPTFIEKVKEANSFIPAAIDTREPLVEVIVRVGAREIGMVKRCLDSLAAQSYPNLGLIIVSFQRVDGLDELLATYGSRFKQIKRIASAPTGFRSTALWDGMRLVEAEYFCNLDDDDTLHPNHVCSLVALLEKNGARDVAYSGCVQVQDESGHYYSQPNFRGPLGARIKETRRLLFLEQFSQKRLLQLDNYIVSNAFLARRSVLTDRDLADPKLVVAEDVYLYLLYLRRGAFLFSWRATAEWHWRSSSEDNSMMAETCQAECGARVQLRTQFFYPHSEGVEIVDLIRRPVSLVYKRFPWVKTLVRRIQKWIGFPQRLD